jgi:hypothetical protein
VQRAVCKGVVGWRCSQAVWVCERVFSSAAIVGIGADQQAGGCVWGLRCDGGTLGRRYGVGKGGAAAEEKERNLGSTGPEDLGDLIVGQEALWVAPGWG